MILMIRKTRVGSSRGSIPTNIIQALNVAVGDVDVDCNELELGHNN